MCKCISPFCNHPPIITWCCLITGNYREEITLLSCLSVNWFEVYKRYTTGADGTPVREYWAQVRLLTERLQWDKAVHSSTPSSEILFSCNFTLHTLLQASLSPLLIYFFLYETIVFCVQRDFFVALKGRPPGLQLTSAKPQENNCCVALTSPSLGHGLPFCVYLLWFWRFFCPPSANLHSKGSVGAVKTRNPVYISIPPKESDYTSNSSAL